MIEGWDSPWEGIGCLSTFHIHSAVWSIEQPHFAEVAASVQKVRLGKIGLLAQGRSGRKWPRSPELLIPVFPCPSPGHAATPALFQKQRVPVFRSRVISGSHSQHDVSTRFAVAAGWNLYSRVWLGSPSVNTGSSSSPCQSWSWHWLIWSLCSDCLACIFLWIWHPFPHLGVCADVILLPEIPLASSPSSR